MIIFEYEMTKEELQSVTLELSKYVIDSARQQARRHGPESLLIQEHGPRSQMQPTKVEHFTVFMMQTAFICDIANGTKNLRMDNGDIATVPNIVRNVIISRLIKLNIL